jgi:hypothetical protein
MPEHPTFDYMRATEHQAIADQWQKYKGFTVRPLPSTQDYYQSVTEKFTKPEDQLMVYGGTPEIRTAILTVGRKATLVDRSQLMVEAMGLLIPTGVPLAPSETLVVGDWLDMPFKKPFATAAFGDDAVNMAPWEKFPQFMKGTHTLLEKDGVYACHLLVQPEERYRKQTVAEVIREYEAGKIPTLEDLASRINFTFYDDRTYQMGWQRSIAGLKEAQTSGDIKTDYGFTERFALCNSIFACPPQNDFEKVIEPMFSIEEVFYPTEYDYSRFEPLYLLRKK